MKRAVHIAAGLLLVLAAAPAAFAHGDQVKTNPKKGSSVSAVPADVTVSLSEDPTPDAVLKIKDGCGNDVVEDVTVDGDSIVAAIGEAQPGKWTASWRAISSVDGHATDGTFAFTVAGKKDCSPDEPSEAEGESSNGNGSSSNVQAGGPSNGDGQAASDEGSSFPVIPVVVGAAALIGLAFVARSAGAR